MKKLRLFLLLSLVGSARPGSIWEEVPEKHSKVTSITDLIGLFTHVVEKTEIPFICVKGTLGKKGDDVTNKEISTDDIIGQFKVSLSKGEEKGGSMALKDCQKVLQMIPYEKNPYVGPLTVINGSTRKIVETGKTLPRKDYFCIKGTIEGKKVNSKITTEDVHTLLDGDRFLGTFGPSEKHDKVEPFCIKKAQEIGYEGKVTIVRAQDNKISAIKLVPKSKKPISTFYTILKDPENNLTVGDKLEENYLSIDPYKKNVVYSNETGTREAVLDKAIGRLKDKTTVAIKGAYEGPLAIIREKDRTVVEKIEVDIPSLIANN